MSPLLNKAGIKQVQRIVGLFLYYGRAINNTIPPSSKQISLMQSKPTEKNKFKNINVTGLPQYLPQYYSPI